MILRVAVLVALFAVLAAVVVYDRGLVDFNANFNAAAPAVAAQPDFPEVPRIPFKTLEGEVYEDFHAIKAPKVLINFWASWCAPCVREFPALLDRVKAADGELALVAISSDDDAQAMLDFIAELDARTNGATQHPDVYWVADPGQAITLHTFGTHKLPETIVLDKERRMVKKFVGETDWLKVSF